MQKTWRTGAYPATIKKTERMGKRLSAKEEAFIPQELKMKSLEKACSPHCYLSDFGGGLLWLSASGAFKIIRGQNRWILALTELAGQYVEAEVEVRIYSGYAYTERTNESTNHSTITEREYIIPVGDAGYMGFAVDAEYIDTADALLDALYAMLTGESNTPGELMNVKGTTKRMPKDSLEFYHQVIGYDELTAEAQQLFCQFVLKVGYGRYAVFHNLVLYHERGRGIVCSGMDAGQRVDRAVSKADSRLPQSQRKPGGDVGAAGSVLPEHRAGKRGARGPVDDV